MKTTSKKKTTPAVAQPKLATATPTVTLSEALATIATLTARLLDAYSVLQTVNRYADIEEGDGLREMLDEQLVYAKRFDVERQSKAGAK